MAPAERLKTLPGYFAFTTGVMFFIGLASKLTSESAAASLGVSELRVMGYAVLVALLAIAAGFASMARVESAKRAGARVSFVWIAPSAAVGLPLGRAVAAGVLDGAAFTLPIGGLVAAIAAAAWLGLRARQEIRA